MPSHDLVLTVGVPQKSSRSPIMIATDVASRGLGKYFLSPLSLLASFSYPPRLYPPLLLPSPSSPFPRTSRSLIIPQLLPLELWTNCEELTDEVALSRPSPPCCLVGHPEILPSQDRARTQRRRRRTTIFNGRRTSRMRSTVLV